MKLLNAPRLDKETLMGYYEREVMIRDIAEEVGVSRRTIERWNEYWGITGKEIGYVREGVCMVCGKEFKYWRNLRRVYCNRGCYMKVIGNTLHSHRRVTERHDNGEGVTRQLSKQTYLARAWKVFDKKGIKRGIGWVMHHLDGDITNNSPENLFVFYSHSAHTKYHHLLRRGGYRKLKHIVDGVYVGDH